VRRAQAVLVGNLREAAMVERLTKKPEAPAAAPPDAQKTK
jgi:hypothetical protein